MTSTEPNRGANDVKALTHIVSRHAQLNADIKAMKVEQKELEDSAWEKCGKSPKAIRQLSKESAWDGVKREQQRLLEEEIDQGRAALGMLVDLPLGEAAVDAMKKNGLDADEPQHHVTNPKYKAKEQKGAKRNRGRREAEAF